MAEAETGNASARHQDGVPFDVRGENNPPTNATSFDGAQQPRKGMLRRVWKLMKLALFLVVTPLLCYLLLAVVGGLWVVNPEFEPTAGGVEVFIFSGDVHSDFIFPIANEHKDWRSNFPLDSFSTKRNYFTHVSIGWGERNFYLETPTWSDLKASTVASALLTPTETVMHVELIHFQPVISASVMKTRISVEQYQSLVAFVEKSFADRGQRPDPIADVSYGDNDHFYSAVGNYHLFRTCNNWAGDAMKAAGMKVGKFTPLPKQVFWHLER